ncbi:heparinase II/III-family protein [Pelagibacteraceae bacterium]|nr:heparinase II/III-family protein [Pelagibacteraceae bacterium]
MIRKVIYIYILCKFKSYKNLSFVDLNFRKIDFTNYKIIKSFIFKENFYKLKNKNIHNFDFLNFSNKLGGKIGINLSKKTIFDWFNQNKNKLSFPWIEDLAAKRLINLLYNYEYINSSSNIVEKKKLDTIIFFHMQRVLFDFSFKKISEVSSFDIIGYLLSSLINKKINSRKIEYIKFIVEYQIDKLGMHKSYNILEHSKFINNLNEIRNILLFFNVKEANIFDELILKMKTIQNQYFHNDGTFPLFNGSNNIYTKIIYDSLNKDTYLVKRDFTNIENGIAFYGDKNKKLFFDVVQPNQDMINSNLSAGTLSIEWSGFGEKIFTNCGASENSGKNPEYLRYSAAHSTIILQNTNVSEIKEGNPHIKFPQSVVFRKESNNERVIFEGSHNGYIKKFKKIIKRKLIVYKNRNKLEGEDTFISYKKNQDRLIFHIRFHLAEDMTFNFTNNKKNIILKTRLNNIWLFKCDTELIVEDSILVDYNFTKPIKQIVIKGIITGNKLIKKWSIEKI